MKDSTFSILKGVNGTGTEPIRKTTIRHLVSAVKKTNFTSKQR